MPLYNVTLKPDSPEDQLQKAKDTAKEQGGTIKHEFNLIKGFTVEFPEDKIDALSTNEHVNVEQDGEMRTQ